MTLRRCTLQDSAQLQWSLSALDPCSGELSRRYFQWIHSHNLVAERHLISAQLCNDPEPQKSCPPRCPWCPWCPGSSLGMIKSTQTDCLHRQLRGRSDSRWHGRKGGEDEDQGTNDQTWNPIKHYNNTSTHHFTTTNKDNNSSSNSSSSNKKKKKQWQWHEDDNHWPQRQW